MAFKNRDRLRRKLKRIPVEARKAVRMQMRANGAELVQTQKRFSKTFDDPTGALEGTIRNQDTSTSTSISQRVSAGGPNAPFYASWVEFGTANSEPRPFFWPAYRMLKRRFGQRVSRAAKKAVREAVK